MFSRRLRTKKRLQWELPHWPVASVFQLPEHWLCLFIVTSAHCRSWTKAVYVVLSDIFQFFHSIN